MYTKKNKHLLDEFSDATGRSFKRDYSSAFEREYKEWVDSNRKLGILYTQLLDSLNLSFKTSNTAEIGKGQYDSVVLPFETSLITTRFNDNSEYKDRIINGDFYISGVDPYINDRVSKYDSYMTQNILSSNEIICWDYMHNNGIYDIIVGMYGRKYDLNVEKKLNILRNLGDHLSADHLIYFTTVEDAYLGVVASKRKKVLKDVPTFGNNIE